MNNYPKVMISMPMKGLSTEEISTKWNIAQYHLIGKGYEAINSIVNEDIPAGTKQIAVWYLAKSIEYMSQVDAVYFCNGWKTARGCKIEHEIATQYGLECIYESDDYD